MKRDTPITARADGESVDVLVAAIEDWAAATGVNETTVSLDDRPRLTTATDAGGERS